MQTLPNLEIHLVHGCNLTCESCSHYSNQGLTGTVSLEEAEVWMHTWKHRISPRKFSLVGGEPTIHPKLPEIMALARKYWPNANLRIATNGFFLNRHPTLPLVMQNDSKMFIHLSIHHESQEYREKQKPVFYLLDSWKNTYGIQVIYSEVFRNWTRRYKGFGSEMEPYRDNQPRQSWEQCPAKYSMQLFEGKLWKCAPLTYLKIQHARHPLSEKWQPYLQYRPLESDCTDEQLEKFIGLEEESFCQMCPANPERFELPNPLARHNHGVRS